MPDRSTGLNCCYLGPHGGSVSSMRTTMAPDISCCELRRQLAEQFAVAARLYSEAAAILALNASAARHFALREKVQEAQQRAEAAFVALEEHFVSHR
jgi:hypothetical protein